MPPFADINIYKRNRPDSIEQPLHSVDSVNSVDYMNVLSAFDKQYDILNNKLNSMNVEQPKINGYSKSLNSLDMVYGVN